jgi:hypothetical protein
MNEIIKKHALSGSVIILSIVMGLQTFVFGNSNIQTLKDAVANLSERIAKLEISSHE